MDSRRRTPVGSCVVAFASAAAACALLIAAPAAAQAQQQRHGVQLHPLWSGVSPAQADRQLDLARRTGSDLVRIDLSWSSLELAGRGRLNRPYVRRADHFMRSARRRGLRVVVSLWGTPCWAAQAPRAVAQGCRGAWWARRVNAYPPRHPADYARVAAWVADRWKRSVTALEIWNEPNDPFFLTARDPAAAYGRLVRASYRPVKRAAPGVTVLAGAISYSDGEFLGQLYVRGRIRGSYDALSYHPYTNGRDPAERAGPLGPKTSFVDGAAFMRSVMAANGGGGPLWITEVGSSTCTGSATCVSEATQAEQIRSFLSLTRSWADVPAVIVYSLVDAPGPATRASSRYGLLRADLRPKASWAAYREAIAP